MNRTLDNLAILLESNIIPDSQYGGISTMLCSVAYHTPDNPVRQYCTPTCEDCPLSSNRTGKDLSKIIRDNL